MTRKAGGPVSTRVDCTAGLNACDSDTESECFENYFNLARNDTKRLNVSKQLKLTQVKHTDFARLRSCRAFAVYGRTDENSALTEHKKTLATS